MADSIAKSSSSEINDGKPAVKQKSEVRLEDSLPFFTESESFFKWLVLAKYGINPSATSPANSAVLSVKPAI